MVFAGGQDEPAASGLRIELELEPAVNLARQQNAVAVIRGLRLHNASGRKLDDVLVRITTQPEFAAPLEIRIAALEPEADSVISPSSLKLLASRRVEPTELTAIRIQVDVLVGRQLLASQVGIVDALAYDERSKTGAPPKPSPRVTPAAPPRPPAVTPAGPPNARLENWQRKLLDLSLRNRLINFRDTKKTLRVMCPDLPSLEDALSNGEAFQILPRAQQDAAQQELLEEFKSHRLHTDVTKEELERRVVAIFREARSSLEESGANTLYLALGFLKWFETPTSQQPRLAPIILVPLELERKSVREGFRIRQSDDEPRINTTLIELLSKDFALTFPDLDPLPQDDSGINVSSILATFRQAIQPVDRWAVVDDAQIGLFSFTKFLMWKDLRDRAGDLLKNDVVRHLAETPTEPFPDQGPFPDPAELDATYAPDQTFCPVSCDSSQLAAVYAAAGGKSFVLDGPPGTGKSQSITNIISHALANGQTVLFVSEKMAALNVVKSRLEKVGLGAFCLELHSNKAHKVEVIRQLGEALDQTGVRNTSDWEEEAARLRSLRNELNAHVEALHRRRASGESLFQGLSRLIGLRDTALLPLKWESPDAVDKARLYALRDLVQQIETTCKECGDPSAHPWRGVGAEEWGPTFQRDVEASIEALSTGCDQLKRAAAPMGQLLGFSNSNWNIGGFGIVDELASLFACPISVSTPMLTAPDFEHVRDVATDWAASINERARLQQQLFPRYNDSLLRVDHAALRRQLQEGESRWFLPRWLARRAVRRQLLLLSSQPQKLDAAQMLRDIDGVARLLQLESHITERSAESKQILGPQWSDSSMDEKAVTASLQWSARFRAAVSQVQGVDPANAPTLQTTWVKLACEQQDQLKPGAAAATVIAGYRDAMRAFREARADVEQKLTLDGSVAWPAADNAPMIQQTRDVITRWNANSAALRPWCSWRKRRAQAIAQNLAPLVEAYEAGTMKCADIPAVFDRSFYQWWCDAITESEPLLRGFFGPELVRRIRQFQQVDEKYMQLTREEIKARLAANIPSVNTQVNSKSEMGILRNLLQQKRPRMAIRTLLQKIPDLLHRIKPCMLMSPISVAQYLDPAYPPFDLVVFDEASQMPAWDAVGAIARGRKAIIGGDPRQLPPTSFFDRSESDEDVDEDKLQDLESVLDDCIAAQLPRCQLMWHYRSRHESLIAFSNRQYYDERLLTFPSPDRRMGVSLRHVDGVYDKSGSRTNKAEAEAVVHEVVQRLQNPDTQSHSIGIVTFSMAQQELIEDLLDEHRREAPEIEPFFSADAEEPVFVKNLENVQGDERDVILFSVCYGPDASKRVSMNFGPLNRDGGERRLNVAITRAREEVMVFSTLMPEHIDVSKTRARGVQDLMLFLDYAGRGETALKEFSAATPAADFDSPFEKLVGEAIRNLGYDVHSQVGCSGYRIDLGVVDPQAPGRYLLGIECDGANYHSARTARDRDRLRQSVLEGLGWHLHRVWSSDWWSNPQEEIRKITAAIDEARSRIKPEPTPEKPAAKSPTASEKPAPPPEPEPAQEATPLPPAAAPGDQHSVYAVYAGGRKGEPDSFYERPAGARIRKVIEEVVECEAPISLDLLVKRLAEQWGIQRATANVVDRVLTLAQTAEVSIVAADERQFVWKRGVSPDTYEQFRIPGTSEDSRREAKDISPEEVANAICHIMTEQGSMPRADLIRETGRLLGFQRIGQNVEKSVQAGIALLEQRGRLTTREEVMVLEDKGRSGP